MWIFLKRLVLMYYTTPVLLWRGQKSWSRHRDDEFCEGSLLYAYLQRSCRNPGTAETMHRNGMFPIKRRKVKTREWIIA